jgi:seryl-tRNA synthetase
MDKYYYSAQTEKAYASIEELINDEKEYLCKQEGFQKDKESLQQSINQGMDAINKTLETLVNKVKSFKNAYPDGSITLRGSNSLESEIIRHIVSEIV